MWNLYKVVIEHYHRNLKFNFEVQSGNKDDAETIAIEYLVDNEEYTDQVMGCNTASIDLIEENTNYENGGVLKFEVSKLR